MLVRNFVTGISTIGACFLPLQSRVNRKRRGPYREAVRQATLEAERTAPAAPAPAQSPLALAGSPPEVDVAS